MKWKHLFKPHILERGVEYYASGCVKAFESGEDQITAVVSGAEDYEVCIDLDEGEIIDMDCTCPYAESGEHCKHMAAVLCAWEEGAASEERQADDTALKACVDGADIGLVRRFLTELLQKDERARHRFMAEVQPEKATSRVSDVKAMIDRAVRRCMMNGYMDAYEEEYFIDRMCDIMADEVTPRLERGEDRDAFELSRHIFLSLGEVESIDEESGLTEIAERCEEVWETIAARADATLKKEMFDWLLKQRGGAMQDYSHYCASVLARCFDEPEYLQVQLTRTQAALDEALQRAREDWHYAHSTNGLAMECIRLMERMGRTESENADWCRAYWHLTAVRQYAIGKCREAGDWNRVVSLLKESIALDAHYAGIVAEYHMQLKEAYAKLGLKDEYRRELRNIVAQIKPGQMDCWREYRALFESGDWPQERDRLLADLSEHSNIEALYAEEGLYDRLLERVMAARGLYTLQSYEKLLLKHYPEQVLEKYTLEINRAARNPAKRSVYRDWANILKHMKKMPGGKPVVDKIVATWRIVYKARRAMMDELKGL